MINRFTIEDGRYKDNERGVKSGNPNTTLSWFNELADDLSIAKQQLKSDMEKIQDLQEELNIVKKELNIAIEQGYAPSDDYLRSIGDRQVKYKYWILKQIERGRKLQ